MTAAQKLLCHTDDPIGSISKAVGYQSINTFYSAFKTFCGITPDQYRKEFSDTP
jgi:AraC-like DNA-binding protein